MIAVAANRTVARRTFTEAELVATAVREGIDPGYYLWVSDFAFKSNSAQEALERACEYDSDASEVQLLMLGDLVDAAEQAWLDASEEAYARHLAAR